MGCALILKGGTRSESPARGTWRCPIPGLGFLNCVRVSGAGLTLRRLRLSPGRPPAAPHEAARMIRSPPPCSLGPLGQPAVQPALGVTRSPRAPRSTPGPSARRWEEQGLLGLPPHRVGDRCPRATRGQGGRPLFPQSLRGACVSWTLVGKGGISRI